MNNEQTNEGRKERRNKPKTPRWLGAIIQSKKRIKKMWETDRDFMLRRSKAGGKATSQVYAARRERLKLFVESIQFPIGKRELINVIANNLGSTDSRNPESIYRRMTKYQMIHLCPCCMQYSITPGICVKCNPLV